MAAGAMISLLPSPTTPMVDVKDKWPLTQGNSTKVHEKVLSTKKKMRRTRIFKFMTSVKDP